MDQEQASLLYLASLELSDSELMNTTENRHDVNNKPEKKRRSLIRLGVNPDLAFMWSRSRMGGWAVAQRRSPHSLPRFNAGNTFENKLYNE